MEQPLHGNYHSYYQTKRPELNDERIALLPKAFFKGKTVLDIGCNEGRVTCEVAQRHGAACVVGVDIDPALIRAAWKRRRVLWSLQRPPLTPSANRNKVEDIRKIKKRKRDNTVSLEYESDSSYTCRYYFPLSMQHLFGALPIPTSDVQSPLGFASFPHNVTFIHTDWISDPIDYSQKYEIVLALSITKWIHLNYNDAGLITFFRRIFDVLRPGCGSKLVLEPQHWEGYAKAKRMNPKLKESGKDLQIKPDDFEGHLVKIGFRPPERMGSVGQGGMAILPFVAMLNAYTCSFSGLRRSVDVYEKP